MANATDILEKALALSKRPLIKAHRRGDGPAWHGRPAPPSWSAAACGWRGRTKYLRAHRREAGHANEKARKV